MITRVEAKQYRCLRAIDQPLGPFQVLVGPNGSGKSAFLDSLDFLATLMSDGLEAAVSERTENFHDLVWGREGTCFEIAIEARLPVEAKEPLRLQFETVRYEIAVKIDAASDRLVISKEIAAFYRGRFWPDAEPVLVNRPKMHFLDARDRGIRVAGDPELDAYRWLEKLLQAGVRSVVLDDRLLRKPSPPGRDRPRVFDGSNLARLIFQLQTDSPASFNMWLAHIQTALPDLDSLRTVPRPEEHSRYLMLRYKNGVEVPSWIVSDGTLRLLALTLLAYLPDFKGIYLVEEPENGVHPTALETIYQSLSSFYDGQVFVTSHSPTLLNLPALEEILCFQKTADGTKIVRGDQHPALQEWKESVSLGQLFAAGVLG